MSRASIAGPFVAAALLAAAGSCATEDDPGALADAGDEAFGILPEAGPDLPDVDVPPGEPCGNRGGLQAGSPWPLRGGCPKRAGYGEVLGPTTALTDWALDMPAAESSPVVSASGTIWVGTKQGSVIAVAANGFVRSELFTIDAGVDASVRSSAAMATNGAAVIAGADGVLYGLEVGPAVDAGGPPSRATVRFSLAIGPMASSPVIAGDGTIYVGTLDGRLVAVSRTGNAIEWTATTNDTMGTSPAIGDDGTVYAGSSDGKVYAFTPNGMPKWTREVGSPVVTSPALGGDDTVYVGTEDGKLHALEPTLGAPRWSFATGGKVTGGPTVYAGTVLVGSADKKLHALNTPDGTVRFQFATLGEVATPVITADGTVYVGSTDGKLYAIRPTGTLFFAVNARGVVRGAPALTESGLLYLTTETGIVAIGP